MTTINPSSSATSKRISQSQSAQIQEHTAKFESATGGEAFIPSQPQNQLSKDLAAMEALFKNSCKG